MNVFKTITCLTPIEKGWSSDKKYCAVTTGGQKYLLRTSSADRLERKRREFERMEEVAALGIPMCLPIEFGIVENDDNNIPAGTVYTIHSWIDGDDAKTAITTMNHTDQYRYGLDAGRILTKIHTIPAPADIPDWEIRFNPKIDYRITLYENCPLKYESGSDVFLEYIGKNRHLLKSRPQCYQHGDYHIGNLMIDREGILTVIDFDRDDYGDPWEEFNRIVWCAQAAPAFASGMVDGYFNGNVPIDFWKLLALYISSNAIGSIPWAIPFGEEEVQVMRKQTEEVLQWYDGMQNVVPAWYQSRENML